MAASSGCCDAPGSPICASTWLHLVIRLIQTVVLYCSMVTGSIARAVEDPVIKHTYGILGKCFAHQVRSSPELIMM